MGYLPAAFELELEGHVHAFRFIQEAALPSARRVRAAKLPVLARWGRHCANVRGVVLCPTASRCVAPATTAPAKAERAGQPASVRELELRREAAADKDTASRADKR